MRELLRELACFSCEYKDDCEDEWEEGHSHCDEKMNDAKRFAERTGIGQKLTFHSKEAFHLRKE